MSDFLLPLQPPPPRPLSRRPPRPSHHRELDFGPFRVRFGSVRVCLDPFGSISGLFRVRFGSVWVGWVESGRGASLREKNIISIGGQTDCLEGREPPLTLRRENQYLYFGRFFPCTPGPFSCSTGLFVHHSHRAGPVLQEFGFVLRVGVRHSTSVLRPLPWG